MAKRLNLATSKAAREELARVAEEDGARAARRDAEAGVVFDPETDGPRLRDRAQASADEVVEGYDLCHLLADDWWLFQCIYIARFMAGYRIFFAARST